MGISTKSLLILLLFLLTFCGINKERILAQEVESGIVVQIRSPAFIKTIGKRYGYKNAVGLSFYREKPCRIIVPELTKRTMRIWIHEIRHCREGFWHN